MPTSSYGVTSKQFFLINSVEMIYNLKKLYSFCVCYVLACLYSCNITVTYTENSN